MENEAIRFEHPDEKSSVSGLEFILKDLQTNEHLRESVRAAELMQSFLMEAHTGPNRGVKQAGLAVLNTAKRPAILVETGYSTNPQDGKLLSTRSSQRNLAASMADAIVAYLRQYEQKVGSPRAPRVLAGSSTTSWSSTAWEGSLPRRCRWLPGRAIRHPGWPSFPAG
jgi:N-acetylmuramoyl-L-alanine amidase